MEVECFIRMFCGYRHMSILLIKKLKIYSHDQLFFAIDIFVLDTARYRTLLDTDCDH